MAMQFNNRQTWVVAGAFVILVIVVIINGIISSDERQRQIELSNYIIDDIKTRFNLPKEQAIENAQMLENLANQLVPTIQNQANDTQKVLQRYATLVAVLSLDTDEDVEQIKATHELILKALNITESNPVPDNLVVRYNGTHLNINNQTQLYVADVTPTG